MKFTNFLRTVILTNICECQRLDFILKSLQHRCFFCELFKNTYFVENLHTVGSDTPMQGSLFSKIARLNARRLFTVLEKDFSTGISL